MFCHLASYLDTKCITVVVIIGVFSIGPVETFYGYYETESFRSFEFLARLFTFRFIFELFFLI
jgi:hypothetical protein